MTDPHRYRYILGILSEEPVPVRRIYLKPGEHVVGSESGCDIVIPIAGVSRRHATIEVLDDGGAVVTDLGSKNGTFLGGKRVKRGAAPGAAPITFGSVRAELIVVSQSSGHLLIESDGPQSLTPEQAPPGQSDRSPTAETSMVERLVRALSEVLCTSERTHESAEACAVQIARRWSTLLAPDRLELGRSAPGGDAVLAVVGARLPAGPPHLEVRAPSGWWARVWKTDGRSLARLQPVLEVALRTLSAPLGVGDPIAVPAPSPPADLSLPAPGSLSSEIRGLYGRAAKVALGEIPILVLGESGTGKEVLARWVHARSPRADRMFLSFNCAAMPRDLLEAELFGIEKGVATGVDRRPGILEQADGGTILLDEIGDMALETQAKLLRVLEGVALLPCRRPHRDHCRRALLRRYQPPPRSARRVRRVQTRPLPSPRRLRRLAAAAAVPPGGHPAAGLALLPARVRACRAQEPRHHPRRARRPCRVFVARQHPPARKRDLQGRAAARAR